MEPSPQASPLRVVFLAAALLGILGTALSLTRTRGGVLDAGDFLGALYGSPVPAPAGFDAPSAIKLPTGEKVATFEGSGDAARDGRPTQLVLMEFPVSRAEEVLKDQFQSLRFDSGDSKWGGGGRGGRRGRGGRGGGGRGGGPPGEKGDDDDKPKLQDAGRFLWHDYDATYARLRYGPGKPEDDKPYYDVMRVNLSVDGHCVIAYLRFPDRHQGELAVLREALAPFRPESRR